MAVATYTSTTLSAARQGPVDGYSKVRLIPFSVTADVAGDITSIAKLCKLPPGKVRVLPHKSKIFGDLFGAARTLSFGYAAHKDSSGTTVAANQTAFGSGVDVSAATLDVKIGTAYKVDLFSRAGIEVQAQVAGGTWPLNAKLEGYIAVLVE